MNPGCLDSTDWPIFRDFSGNLSVYVDLITDYVRFCMDGCVRAHTFPDCLLLPQPEAIGEQRWSLKPEGKEQYMLPQHCSPLQTFQVHTMEGN